MDSGRVSLPGLSLSADARANGTVIVRLRGELAMPGAPGLRDTLAELLRPGAGWLVIELSAVTRCDVSGLAVLVGAGHRARQAGGSLALAAPAAPVSDVLHATGLHRHLEIFSTTEAASLGRDAPGPAPAAAPARDEGAPGRRTFAYSQAAAGRLRRVLGAAVRPALP